MASRRRALLFLPSPQGLVEYDVLEDAVFLGATKERGPTAAPSPFREAVFALTWNGASFEVRALPGEAPPEVDGAPADGAVLRDGARIRVGDQVVLFREERPAATPAAVAAVGTVAPAGGPARRGVARRAPRRSNPWVTALSLFGAALLLVGVWRAVEHLKDMKAARETGVDAPEPPTTLPEGPAMTRAARDLEKVREQEREAPDDVRGAIDRYRDLADQRHPGTPEAEAAATRVRELLAEAGRRDMDRLEAEATQRMAKGDFQGLLEDLRRVESRYGTTPAGKRAETLSEQAHTAARTALDDLVAKVGPLIATDPRRAHSALIGSNLRLPADLDAELASLLERTESLIHASGGSPRPPAEPTPEPTPGRTPPRPDGPKAPEPRGPATPPPEPSAEPTPAPPKPSVSDDEVVAAWRAARADLLAGKYDAALAAYDALLSRFADSDRVRGFRSAIEAGRLAALAGAKGPAAILHGGAETKNGRLEVAYRFDDASVVDQDFTAVTPFASDLGESIETKDGVVRLGGATGLFHKVVFTSDVRLEVEAVAEVAHDVGLIALADSDEYRAILFNVANTRFKLKKGDAARVQPGHVVWFVGEGAWAAADAGVHGFIKIAERPNSKLQAGDAIHLELERKRDRCSAAFQAKSDGVSLEGTVRGDDGRGMGSAQVGAFANGGTLVVRSFKVSGVVDERWWTARVQQLVAADPGPQ